MRSCSWSPSSSSASSSTRASGPPTIPAGRPTSSARSWWGGGYPAPDPGTVQRLLGKDGGIVCESPDDALRTALWKIQLSNGLDGPGQRPVIADTRAVGAERIVLQVYCPDQVEAFDRTVDELRTDSTVRR
ncbi:hypothetical protein [Streptomyces sp. NPDC054771]